MVDGVFDASSGRGQLMERMTFVQSGELSLDAIYLRGKRRPAAVIVPAIHEPGGSMEGPIANELAYAIGYAGHASLRFAWPGQGASEGERLAAEAPATELLPHLAEALDHLRETAMSPAIALVALRDGARAALPFTLAHETVPLLVLIDPPSDMDEAIRQAGDQRPVVMVLARDEDATARRLADPPAKLIVIPETDRSFRRNLGRLGRQVADLFVKR